MSDEQALEQDPREKADAFAERFSALEAEVATVVVGDSESKAIASRY